MRKCPTIRQKSDTPCQTKTVAPWQPINSPIKKFNRLTDIKMWIACTS